MPKKSKLTQSVKDDIVKRRHQGKTLAEIGREFGIGTSTVQYVVDTYTGNAKSEKPDFPAAFSDFQEAICIALACKTAGFDSSVTDFYCKKFNCSVDELKNLCKWFSINGAIVDKNDRQNLENRLSYSQKQLSKANKTIKAKESELKAANKQNTDLKLKNKQAEGAVTLLKKVSAGVLERQQLLKLNQAPAKSS